MNIRFDVIKVRETYTRNQLANIWGLNGTMYLKKGCVSSKASPYVILFYTEENSCGYYNSFDGKTLKADSDAGHKTDKAKIDAFNGHKEVHLFYRNLEIMPFTYYGQVKVTGYSINKERPSVFEYALLEKTTGV